MQADDQMINTIFTLLDYAPSGLFVVDEDLRVVFWNSTMERWSGRERARVVGRSLPEMYERVSQPQFLEPIKALFGTGEPVVFPADKYHYLLPIDVDDRGGCQQQHVQLSCLPLSDLYPPLALVAIQDVTSSAKALKKQQDAVAALQAEVAAKELIQTALDEERNFLQDVLDGVPDPIKVIDANYDVLLMNRAAMGYVSSGSMMTCYSINYGRTEPCCQERTCPVRQVIATRKSAQIIHEMYVNETEKRFFETKASPLFRDDGSVWGVIEVSRDITIRLEMEEKLRASEARQRELAHHDALTGLPNRLLLNDRLHRAVSKAERYGHKVAVLFLDLDKFKNINDTLGHDAGDELLREIGQRLQGCLRESDTVARLGGDEFVVILEEISAQHESVVVCRKILTALRQPVILAGQEAVISTSIGVSIFPDDSQDVDGLLKCADSAMYLAKEQGRNTFRLFEAEIHRAAFERILMENSLRHAVAEGMISLCYQAIFDMHSRELAGVEALARWQGPDGKMVEPKEFMPVAEESGLIIPIGAWVLEQACRQHEKWLAAGTALPLAVNLSARQFKEPDLVARLKGIVADTGIDPRQLTIEISEMSMVDDSQQSRSVLSAMKEMGLGIAIDNFGTGYSSLSSLARLPLKMLKIDREFVSRVLDSQTDQVIVTAIIALARNLGITVVATGVESAAQHDWLKKQGCPLAQGYYYGAALPADEFAKHYFPARHV